MVAVNRTARPERTDATGAAHISADELQAAWREIAQPNWPSLAQLMAHEIRMAAVRAAARRRQHPQPASTAGQMAPAARAPGASHKAPVFDGKRAAAGERPDEDDSEHDSACTAP